jgi:hypothetical protein
MFNFNWFNRAKYTEQTTATDDMFFSKEFNGKDGNGYQPLPTPKTYAPMPPVLQPRLTEEGYTVGVDNNSNTVFRVVCNGSTITTTMNAGATRKLIRLLEATLGSEDAQNV